MLGKARSAKLETITAGSRNEALAEHREALRSELLRLGCDCVDIKRHSLFIGQDGVAYVTHFEYRKHETIESTVADGTCEACLSPSMADARMGVWESLMAYKPGVKNG